MAHRVLERLDAALSETGDAGRPAMFAFVKAGDRDPAEVLADAVERGRAFLDAGAPVVFVPGKLEEDQIGALVEAFGPRRLTLIGLPGLPALARLQELGVARVSYGPLSQRVALTALAKLVEAVHEGGCAGGHPAAQPGTRTGSKSR